MNPREPRSHHVSAPAPVNRRTARVADAAAATPGPPALSRQSRKSAARALLGTPLADRVQAARPAARLDAAPASPFGAARIAQALLIAASGSGAVLGALQSSWALGAAGAAGLLGAAGWGAIGWFCRRASGASTPALAPPGFDAETLRRLDDLLETVAPELPPAQCAQLVDLKDRFARIAGLLDRIDVDEQFTPEDRMYVVEALRRYLPDTLLACLAVPAAQRHDRLLEEKTAADLLAGQLALLQSELQVREDKLARAAGAALLRQQRFLRSKAS